MASHASHASHAVMYQCKKLSSEPVPPSFRHAHSCLHHCCQICEERAVASGKRTFQSTPPSEKGSTESDMPWICFADIIYPSSHRDRAEQELLADEHAIFASLWYKIPYHESGNTLTVTRSTLTNLSLCQPF